MRHFLRTLLLSFFVLAGIAGCGQKGPLYNSDNPPPGTKLPPNKSYKPVPYPEQKPADDAQGQTQNNP